MSATAVAAPVAACDCPGCADGLEPFTVEHFGVWASALVLDSGDPWVLEPFQEAFLADVFGRHGRPGTCWLVIPEGNGKTTLVAGMALYYLEHFRDAAIPVAATSKDQADTLYFQAEGFVLRSDRMTEPLPDMVRMRKGLQQAHTAARRDLKTTVPRFSCSDGFRRIRFFNGGMFRIRAADEKTGDGIIPRGIGIIDELHRHANLRLYRTWLGKLEKQKAQLIVISTAGEPGGEFEDEREDIRRSADVVERSECFGRFVSGERVLHDWALPEDGDPHDFRLVAAANPFSGVSAESLERKWQRLGSAGGTLQHWRRLTCNLPTRSELAAIQEREWYDAISDVEIPVGEQVWAGLDVGWKRDTTALVPLWWRDNDFRVFGPAQVLVPPRDGSSMHPDVVKRAVVELHERNPLDMVVMDMSDAEDIAAWLVDELDVRVVDRPQSAKFQADEYERFMEALRQGWLFHSGDREFGRHVLNAVAKVLPLGDTRFARPHDSRASNELQDRRVIDALKAAAMVHAVAAEQLGVSGNLVFDVRKVYEPAAG